MLRVWIKKPPALSWLKFNLFLQTVDLVDKIRHLFVVDTEFDKKKATEREYMYNEIIPPIIEKHKILEANEQSVKQLLHFFVKQVTISQNRIVSLQSLMQFHFQKSFFCSI